MNQSLTLQERVTILSKIYSAVPTYFAHWEAVPDLDWDGLYQKYLEKALKTKDRFLFGLLMMEWMAHLKNGHSNYWDKWILEKYNQSWGFSLNYEEGQWFIQESKRKDIKSGEVVLKIDGELLENFYQKQRKYILASGDREARTKFSFRRFLFPGKFTLELSKENRIIIERKKQNWPQPKLQTEGRWLEKGHLAYLNIPAFSNPGLEDRALQYVRQFQKAKTLIVDVRANDGGSTPIKLVEALQDRSYHFYTEASPLNIPLFKVHEEISKQIKQEKTKFFGATLGKDAKKAMEDWARNLDSGFGSMQYLRMAWTSQEYLPRNTLFKGKLVILIGKRCVSAGEDFVVPFKNNHRALLIGEKTMGSTGQPYFYNFGNGISIGIGAKRAYFPDGSPFEGVGIAPDIEIRPSLSDLQSGRDPVLEKARELS